MASSSPPPTGEAAAAAAEEAAQPGQESAVAPNVDADQAASEDAPDAAATASGSSSSTSDGANVAGSTAINAETLRGHLVYSLGGALLLALKGKSFSELPRRELDGSIVVQRREILKSFLIPGKAVRLRRQGAKSAEAQYRWNCPQYKDCPVGYQLQTWDETSDDTQIFLFDDTVFASIDEAIEEVVRMSPKVEVLPCFKFVPGALRVAIKPVFDVTGSAPLAEFRDDGKFLALGVGCREEDSEDIRGSCIIAAAAQHVFALPEHRVRLDSDPKLNCLVLVVKSNQTAKLHLAVERNLAKLNASS
ncbi:Hypothetical Protein FCC1311_071412 [Hondaea fermentalgiana]|uniref:STEEP1 domain-containing protein n=1 Tax=Hondaea fermentalgiana TaxID=2315210 RepID=A0A2R5GJ57_9STRA|nr:Hypothetical Protein FCC1311_071412 [Hondaea fermentalgiana]|eukprot:GBG30920.1 Hypothetical Protein FCC1311_071412 [Hondaea fermentalgiana]